MRNFYLCLLHFGGCRPCQMVFTWVCILIIVSSSTVDFHRSLKMERERRLVLLDCLMAIQHNQMQMNILMAKMQAILDRRKERTCWVRHWITLRPHHGAYGNLMHLLRNEDVQGFRNFTRITPAMFADMVTRLTPRLQKYDTWYRKALPVGLKVAITMRYFASGDSYHSLMYLFYVPHNTISLLVLDVCEAIYAEYGEETISNPSTPEGWKDIAQTFSDRWNFHHCLGALDGKHIRTRHPRTVAPSSTTTRGTTRLYSLPWSRATTSSGGWRWEQVVQVLMPRFGTRAV